MTDAADLAEPGTVGASNRPTGVRNCWSLARLGDHCTKIGSGLTPLGGQSSYAKSGIPLIRSQNVRMNAFDPDGLAFISSDQDSEMLGSRVLIGDVLLNITGASIGRVCVVPDELVPANVNQHVSVIRSDGSWDPKFLSFYLSSPSVQRQILGDQAGATRQALTKAQVEDFRVPLPPLRQQEQITATLSEQMGAVERARAAAADRLAAAQALAAAYIREVFEGPEASAWKRRTVCEVCDLLPSKSISGDGDVTVQAITTACLSERGFRPDGVKTARMRRADASEAAVRVGEVLVARSNTPELVGRASMYEGEPADVVASDLTIRLWASVDEGGVTPAFLTGYLSYLFQTGYWRERAGGASGTMKKITREQICAERVPVPPRADQRRITGELSRRLDGVELLTERIREELEAIEAIPAALLREAFGHGGAGE